MKIFCNTKFKKIIVVLLLVVVLFTTVGPNFMIPKVYAAEDDEGGILAWPIAKLVRWIANLFQKIINSSFGIDVSTQAPLFISNIVFGEVDAFDVNIFSTKTLSGASRDTAALNASVGTLIAKYYGFTRIIAIAASLVILIYVGIRILISTSAGDLTKYKSLLKDWLMALVIVLMMHYIMSLILFTSDSLTIMFKNLNSVKVQNFYDYIESQITKDNGGMALMYSIVKLIFLGMTFAFVVIYAKRTVMIAFLTIVGPLVGISYAVDKIKDGQSQILDKWMKEYVYTALIMPLDALLFSILGGMLIELLNAGNIILAVALLFGYLPLRGWFTEFIGADKAGHAMGGMAAGALMAKMFSNNNPPNRRKGNNNTSNEKIDKGDNEKPDKDGIGSNGSGGRQLPQNGGGNAASQLPVGGEESTAEPSSYNSSLGNSAEGGSPAGGGSPNLPLSTRNSSNSKPHIGRSTVAGMRQNLNKKVRRGALNMAEYAASSLYGGAKGALRAATAMAITGDIGFAAKRGHDAYESGRNNMYNRMDTIERGAQVLGGQIAGTNAKREGLQNIYDEKTNDINASFDEQDQNINNDYMAEDNQISRIESASNLEALSNEDQKQALNYAVGSMDTNAQEEYQKIRNQQGASAANNYAFDYAKEKGGFKNARTAADVKRKNRLDASSGKRNAQLSNVANTANMTRSQVQDAYRGERQSAREEAMQKASGSGKNKYAAIKEGNDAARQRGRKIKGKN